MPQATQPTPAPQAAKPKQQPPPKPPAEFQEGDIAKMDAPALMGILSNAGSLGVQESESVRRGSASLARRKQFPRWRRCSATST